MSDDALVLSKAAHKGERRISLKNVSVGIGTSGQLSPSLLDLRRRSSEILPTDVASSSPLPPSDNRLFLPASFAQEDRSAATQRRLLWQLHHYDQELKIQMELAIAANRTGQKTKKKDKEMKRRKEILREYDLPKNKFSPSALERFNNFFKLKKTKKKSLLELMHQLRLAVHDQRQELAIAIATSISPEKFTRVKLSRKFVPIFARAIAYNMDTLALLFMSRDFPSDVNAPIYTMRLRGPAANNEDEPKSINGSSLSVTPALSITTASVTPAFQCPSYFMLAISYELDDVLMIMLKERASLHQAWYGLTPLMLACYVNGRGNARIANILLECGAPPATGLPIQQYTRMRKLRRLVMPRRQRRNSLATSILAQRKASLASSMTSLAVSSPAPSPPLTQISGRNSPSMNSPSMPEQLQPRPSSASGAFKRSTSSLGNNLPTTSKDRIAAPTNSMIYPLDLAVACNNRDIVSLLLAKMSAEEVQLSQFCLAFAVDCVIIVLLLEAGVSVTQASSDGSTALHTAARRGDLDSVAVLLHYGANLDLPGEFGRTALHEAVRSNNPAMVQYVLFHGAKLDSVSHFGETPMDLAKKMGLAPDDKICRMLEPSNVALSSVPPWEPDVPSIIASCRDPRSAHRREASPKLLDTKRVPDMQKRVVSIGSVASLSHHASVDSLTSSTSLTDKSDNGRFGAKRRSFSNPLTNEKDPAMIAAVMAAAAASASLSSEVSNSERRPSLDGSESVSSSSSSRRESQSPPPPRLLSPPPPTRSQDGDLPGAIPQSVLNKGRRMSSGSPLAPSSMRSSYTMADLERETSYPSKSNKRS